MVARVWTVEAWPDHHLLPHGGEALPSKDASSAPAAAVPCAAATAAGGASAVSETKIELLLYLLRHGCGQRRGSCWGRLGRRRGGALRRRLAWRRRSGRRSSPRVGDVVEDGSGALIVTGTDGGAGEKETRRTLAQVPYLLSLKLNVAEWLEAGKMQWVKLVIMTKATTHQRGARALDFNIITDAEVVKKGAIKEKGDKEIMREIQAIMPLHLAFTPAPMSHKENMI
ncbi:unnamed protein product [Miscanthus lutarioriparius]|uniref:Uncharacterized protein n=1 Tax=Miscanthus lutarioriparius TaxID=422564 RepID=A0A811R486_9POAL|nr:unnamed protein product [Miscanthus lutarioriparius]